MGRGFPETRGRAGAVAGRVELVTGGARAGPLANRSLVRGIGRLRSLDGRRGTGTYNCCDLAGTNGPHIGLVGFVGTLVRTRNVRFSATRGNGNQNNHDTDCQVAIRSGNGLLVKSTCAGRVKLRPNSRFRVALNHGRVGLGRINTRSRDNSRNWVTLMSLLSGHFNPVMSPEAITGLDPSNIR